MPGHVNEKFGGLYHKLVDLLPLLDKSSFTSEIAIKNKFSAEIDAKKTEITDRLKISFSADIDAAANEDYGQGQLNAERKKVFTVYGNQINNASLLTKTKELIKLLVKGEKVVKEANNLEKMILVNQLKEKYQNGTGDKKQAYIIVNQVDNNWVDRTIADLGKFTVKGPQVLLVEFRLSLQSKYKDSVAAQAVFSNNVLDSVRALELAERLYKKVKKAEVSDDIDISLLTFLQSYQRAGEGTIKNQAWQAVNSYNQQAETALNHLQKTDKSRKELIRLIQETKSESELETAYNQVQSSELFQQGEKIRTVVDNLRQRKKVSFKIDQNENISDENKTFLKGALVKLIPETIKNHNDERELVELEKQLKDFQSAPESKEKGKIYKEYKNFIDQILTEISQERERYQQAKQKSDLEINQNGNAKPSPGGLPN
nr:12341_t:CDS:2 [Entrophospora candida]